MKLLDRYCFWGVMKRFIAFLFLLTLLLFLEDLYKHLEQFLSAHVTLYSAIRYYCVHSIVLLPLTVPVAFLLALLFFSSKMLRQQEFIICYTSGIPPFRMVRPIFYGALLTSLALIACHIGLIPRAQSEAQHYIAESRPDLSSKPRHLFFQNDTELVYIRSYNAISEKAEDIVLNCYDAHGHEQSRLRADSGIFEATAHCWHFYDGKITHFDEQHQAIKVSPFQEYVSHYAVPPTIILAHNEKPQNLTLLQLHQLIQDPHTPHKAIYQMRCGDFFWNALMPLLLLWSSLPFLRLLQPRYFVIRLVQLLIYLLLLTGGSHLCTLIALHQSNPWIIGFWLPYGFTLLMPLLLFRLLRPC